MIFLVTTHFRNTHPVLGDQITRLGDVQTDDLQYDAGDFISIGRDGNGAELSADSIAKAKGSKPVALIGHLNQGGRLLDPYTQQLDCARCLGEAAAAVKKQYKALITAKAFLDKDHEQEEIKATAEKITALQARAKTLEGMSAAFTAADKSKKREDVDKIINPAPLKKAA